MLQQNFLFSGTVLENIRVGRPDATDAEVLDVLRRLDCLDLLEALPDGLDDGSRRARRAISLGPAATRLLCPGHAGRSADPDPRRSHQQRRQLTEARIQRALEVLLAGRTRFVVAHRLSTIRHADQVLVLDHGRIVERGTHDELLAAGGVYARLYRRFTESTAA